jgi:hypothetical protein
MGTLRFITFTGVDERTDFDRLIDLVIAAGNNARFLEWGVLYAPSKAGTGGRYPSLEWLEDFAAKANEAGLNIALHICGQAVKDLLESVRTRERSDSVRRLLALAEKFGRVQLNTVGKEADEYVFKQLIALLSRNQNRTCVLLQWNERNQALCRRLSMEHSFEALVDGSGGRGIVPAGWPSLSGHDVRRVGYAGGLGPNNILEQLPLIYAAAGDKTFWIDMEQSLRDENDDFVLDRCQQVLAQVAQVEQAQQFERGRIHGDGTVLVSKLKGLWLDWWVGKSQGLPMVIPPEGAIKAMYLYRANGSYESYQPGENGSEATKLMRKERLHVSPTGKSRWMAWHLDPKQAMTGSVLELAILRAVVAKHFGTRVPKNPAAL